jgi:hypothetical protein
LLFAFTIKNNKNNGTAKIFQLERTFLLSQRLAGFFTAGRYAGYDFSPTANMTLTLAHTVTGASVRGYTGSPVKSGVAHTNQGLTLFEDAAVTLPIGAVGGLPRIDLVILTHSQTQNPGGALGLYSVVQGTPNATPVKPSLPAPDTQIEIGSLYLPASVTALNQSGVVWTQSKVSAMETKASLDDLQDVYDYINSVAGGVWENIALANGWQTDTVETAAYYPAQFKKQGNQVYLRGAILYGSPAPSSYFFALNLAGETFLAESKQNITTIIDPEPLSDPQCFIILNALGHLRLKTSEPSVLNQIYLIDGCILHLD